MTFEKISRLTRIDGLHLSEIRFLQPSDECFYLGEYTAKRGFAYSKINDLVLNLKKEPQYRTTKAWEYKLQAIEKCASYFVTSARPLLEKATLVPIPPSRSKDDPSFDDRILQLLHKISGLTRQGCDVREVIVQERSYSASHSADKRAAPEDLKRLYRVQGQYVEPRPRVVVLVDDVITTGAHFRAAKDLLVDLWPGAKVLGFFVARTVWSTT